MILSFEDEGGDTRYTARVGSWTAEARAQHEKMGFDEVRRRTTDQLETVARSLQWPGERCRKRPGRWNENRKREVAEVHQRITRIDADGRLLDFAQNDGWREILAQGEAVHRELRPGLSVNYVEDMLNVFIDGAQITQVADGGEVRALALWRVFRTTYGGRRLEVDDFVTSAGHRSRGYGATLLRWLASRARELDCQIITLNSANHRVEAHRFYEREGFERFGVHFSRSLSDPKRPT